MLTLYVRTGCPFCSMVEHAIAELGITVEEKNISDAAVAEELLAHGGKQQVPYLIDSARGVAMYESGDIASYLVEHYTVEDTDLPVETVA